MAGARSDNVDFGEHGIPKGYVIEDYFGRDVIRCLSCGHRWYADRMTHWANHVFLVEHRDHHKPIRPKRPPPLKPSTLKLLRQLDRET